jgi:mRNA interferase RelE/StbE
MGEEAYSLKYHRLVPHDVVRLDTFWQGRISKTIEDKLLTQPEIFGKPLRRSLVGCRSLCVGDYRVVFKIEQKVIYIVAIVHRSMVYAVASKRV